MRLRALSIAACVVIVSAPAYAQSSSTEPRPIVVQGAMDIEVAKLVERLANAQVERVGAWTFWRGTVDGYPVIVSKTLKGGANAAAATTIAIERYRPLAIVNQGTAGGLDASLKLHDIVLGTSALNVGAFRSPRRPAGGGSTTLDWRPLDLTAPDGRAEERHSPARFTGDESLLAAARGAATLYKRGRVVDGAIGTADMWNDEIDRLAWLHREYGVMVEEMETAAAAQVAAQLNVPFLGIRIVSDNAIAGIPYDRTTGEACAEFAHQVVRAYIARSVRGAATQTADAPALVGAWRLVSWDERLDDGTMRRNPRTVGSLMYSDSGRMCGVIMDPNRPGWRGRPQDAEVRVAWDGLVTYCGNYEVHASEGFVVHHVDIEKSPSLIGIDRKRWFTFEGPNRLVLRVDPAENQGTTAESRLTWERVMPAERR